MKMKPRRKICSVILNSKRHFCFNVTSNIKRTKNGFMSVINAGLPRTTRNVLPHSPVAITSKYDYDVQLSGKIWSFQMPFQNKFIPLLDLKSFLKVRICIRGLTTVCRMKFTPSSSYCDREREKGRKRMDEKQNKKLKRKLYRLFEIIIFFFPIFSFFTFFIPYLFCFIFTTPTKTDHESPSPTPPQLTKMEQQNITMY